MGDDGASWCLVTTPPNFWEGIDIGSNRLAAAAAPPPPAAQQWEHPAGNLAPTASAKRARQSAMPSGAALPAFRLEHASSSFSSCCHCSSARIRSFLSQIDLHGAIYSSVSRTHTFQTSERGRFNSRVSVSALRFFYFSMAARHRSSTSRAGLTTSYTASSFDRRDRRVVCLTRLLLGLSAPPNRKRCHSPSNDMIWRSFT